MYNPEHVTSDEELTYDHDLSGDEAVSIMDVPPPLQLPGILLPPTTPPVQADGENEDGLSRTSVMRTDSAEEINLTSTKSVDDNMEGTSSDNRNIEVNWRNNDDAIVLPAVHGMSVSRHPKRARETN